MKIAVIGTGYVGLVTGTCFADLGNQVTCIDIDTDKIDKLKQGIVPIYEPGLEKLVIENYKKGTLSFVTDITNVISKVNVVFIAVGTPMGEDGSADLQYVLEAARGIGKNMTGKLIVVDKSTVPVGTADKVKDAIQEELEKREDLEQIPDFHVVSNPEFLKEGAAVRDFMRPDRVVIGSDSQEVIEVMKELYAPFCRTHDRFVHMDVRSAEMTKYAANAMLATKISFMNEIANICELVGADVNQVRVGIGSDSRIGYSFIYPGCGYGGSCFPKDVKALSKIAAENNFKSYLIDSVELVNDNQKLLLAQKIVKRFGENLKGKTFGIWGLAFKPETDDMREAPSIYTIRELTKRGALVKAYDPKARHEAESYYLKDVEGVTYVESKYDALDGADAMVLLTEWKEFKSPDFEEIQKRLKSPVIFDGRNQYSAKRLENRDFEYHQIGREVTGEKKA